MRQWPFLSPIKSRGSTQKLTIVSKVRQSKSTLRGVVRQWGSWFSLLAFRDVYSQGDAWLRQARNLWFWCEGLEDNRQDFARLVD
jgi:hypothetical protein